MGSSVCLRHAGHVAGAAVGNHVSGLVDALRQSASSIPALGKARREAAAAVGSHRMRGDMRLSTVKIRYVPLTKVDGLHVRLQVV